MRRPSRDRFTQKAVLLKLVLFIMLAGGSAGARRRQDEEEQLMEGDDSECLKGLLATVSSSFIFSTWTVTALASPCNYTASSTHRGIYTSTLRGITCNNSRVAMISLPSANLVGTLPSSLSSCYYLQTLDLSSNSLTGALPHSLGALSLLSTLSLSNNQLSGPIPFELATCSSLSSLDLHQNQLSGSIPGQIGLLPLQYFDVSNNKLSGHIPSTLSNTSSGSPRFNVSSFAQNPNLYGFPLNPYPPSSSSYSLSSSSQNARGISVLGILGIACASGIASFLIVYYIVAWLLEVRHKRIAQRELAERELKRKKTRRNIDDSSRSEEYFGWGEVLNQL